MQRTNSLNNITNATSNRTSRTQNNPPLRRTQSSPALLPTADTLSDMIIMEVGDIQLPLNLRTMARGLTSHGVNLENSARIMASLLSASNETLETSLRNANLNEDTFQDIFANSIVSPNHHMSAISDSLRNNNAPAA